MGCGDLRVQGGGPEAEEVLLLVREPGARARVFGEFDEGIKEADSVVDGGREVFSKVETCKHRACTSLSRVAVHTNEPTS